VSHASSVAATSSRSITSTPIGRRQPPTRAREVASAPTFLVTKERRRFAEFADACRRERYIGVCYGPPGVGKTLSARHHAAWDQLEPWLERRHLPRSEEPAPDALDSARTALYTPSVAVTPRRVHDDVELLCHELDYAIEGHLHPTRELFRDRPERSHIELLIVDEADRLETTALEALRDLFDRRNLGSSSSACPASNGGWPATRSSTAASASPTNTGR